MSRAAEAAIVNRLGNVCRAALAEASGSQSLLPGVPLGGNLYSAAPDGEDMFCVEYHGALVSVHLRVEPRATNLSHAHYVARHENWLAFRKWDGPRGVALDNPPAVPAGPHSEEMQGWLLYRRTDATDYEVWFVRPDTGETREYSHSRDGEWVSHWVHPDGPYWPEQFIAKEAA